MRIDSSLPIYQPYNQTPVAVNQSEEATATNKSRSFLDNMENVSDRVRNAWVKAEQETGGPGWLAADGKWLRMPSIMTMMIEQEYRGNVTPFANTSSARSLAEMAIERMDNPLEGAPHTGPEYQQERDFYQAFMKHLGGLDVWV